MSESPVTCGYGLERRSIYLAALAITWRWILINMYRMWFQATKARPFLGFHQSKLKIVTIQWIKSRIWDTVDDWYINILGKNQVSAVFHSPVICRSMSRKFIEHCKETPSLCPSEGHKHGGRKVTETSIIQFCYWSETLLFWRSHTLK